ncbi:hypothetical protein AAFF_G00398700 [Aldrovandia affinis]|uniref:SEFIR domain-containing protein n=1 Tax=Aldrovandia affinis TaxID=143900 RepID=A0AAD7SF10_9TELE|nr:hypothetical protein AAFF_G00398700 [Aldrovandia affinis]
MTFLCGQLTVGLLYLSLWASATVLEKIDSDQYSLLTCEQGLTDCRIRMKYEVPPSPDSEFVHVSKLDLRAILYCERGKNCKPCIQIQIHLTITGLQDDSGQSGDDEEAREEAGSVRLCCYIPNGLPMCKKLEFRLPPAAVEDHRNTEARLSLLVSENVYFGSLLLVSAQTVNQTITIPSEEDVCSPELRGCVEECNVPMLQTVIDEEKGVALLQLDKEDINSSSPVEMCLKYGEEGECRYKQWNGTDISIPLHSVASCMCFQVRRIDGSLASMTCPFRNSKEFLRKTWDRVRVSVVPAQTNSGDAALAWNLTAPCRLEAELWLCRMGEGAVRGGAEQDCRELEGSRQRITDVWQAGWQRGWLKGEFVDIVPHPSLCVLVQVNGMDGVLGPWCPFSTTRRRWVFAAMLGMLMICVAVLGACLLHTRLKSWMSRWCKEKDSRGAGGRTRVVLLCPPDTDPSLAMQVSRLGSALGKMGFSVTADLWSRAEMGALGPVPWLHAQMSRLETEGGRAVLILTHAAWERAGQWGGKKEERPSPYADIFGAALSCLLADRLQGGAAQRFTLVHFQSPPSGRGALEPQILGGLRPYALPSQSFGFLAELTGRRWAGLWPDSWALERALRGRGGGWARQGPGETVPLTGAHTHPQTSRDSCGDTLCV